MPGGHTVALPWHCAHHGSGCLAPLGAPRPPFTGVLPQKVNSTQFLPSRQLCPCANPSAPSLQLPMGSAQGGLQPEQSHPTQGPSRPQAVTEQPKGQFDLVKGISVSPARQLWAQPGFLPWNSNMATAPNTSSSPDPAAAPARAGWALLPTFSPWADVPQLFPQHKWERDIIKGLRMHKAGSCVLH